MNCPGVSGSPNIHCINNPSCVITLTKEGLFFKVAGEKKFY